MNPLRPMHVHRSPWTLFAGVPNRCLGGVVDLPPTTARTTEHTDHITFLAGNRQAQRSSARRKSSDPDRPLQYNTSGGVHLKCVLTLDFL